MRSGIKTVEFWAGVAATVLYAVWPDFPKEAFMAVILWVAARCGQKALGEVATAEKKRSWFTSEFWLTIAFTIAKSIFKELPAELFTGVLAWLFGRTGVKVLKDFAIGKVGKRG